MKDGKKHGEGIYKKDGAVYEGSFKNNLYSGKGKLTLPNGLVFEGEFDSGNYYKDISYSDG